MRVLLVEDEKVNGRFSFTKQLGFTIDKSNSFFNIKWKNSKTLAVKIHSLY